MNKTYLKANWQNYMAGTSCSYLFTFLIVVSSKVPQKLPNEFFRSIPLFTLFSYLLSIGIGYWIYRIWRKNLLNFMAGVITFCLATLIISVFFYFLS